MVDFAAIRTNAGVKTAVTASGEITATTNQTISGKSFTGTVTVPNGVTGVVIQNCLFNGSLGRSYAIDVQGSGSATILDCEFTGDYTDSAIDYHNVTVKRCNFHDLHADGVKVGSNTWYEENWFHVFTPLAGNHSDAMQIFERQNNVNIRRNVIEPGKGGPWNANDALDESVNAALILNESLDTGVSGSVIIDSNYINGGGFSVYFDMPHSTTTFNNNVFERDSYNFGPLDDRAHANQWLNNTFSDNGQVLAMPGSALVPIRHNLCPNPGLKNDNTGWQSSSTPPARITNATGMSRSTAASYTVGTFARTPAGLVAAGLSYTLSIEIKPTASISGNIYIEWQRNDSSVIQYTTKAYTAPGGAVTRIFVTDVPPVDGTLYQAAIIVDGADFSVNPIILTAVLIEQSATNDLYFDGDSPNASWDGTAGNSPSTLTVVPGGSTTGSLADKARANMLSTLGLVEPQKLSVVDLMVLVLATPGQVLVPKTDASAATHYYRYLLSLRP